MGCCTHLQTEKARLAVEIAHAKFPFIKERANAEGRVIDFTMVNIIIIIENGGIMFLCRGAAYLRGFGTFVVINGGLPVIVDCCSVR